jgi:hypothetical protein
VLAKVLFRDVGTQVRDADQTEIWKRLGLVECRKELQVCESVNFEYRKVIFDRFE